MSTNPYNAHPWPHNTSETARDWHLADAREAATGACAIAQLLRADSLLAEAEQVERLSGYLRGGLEHALITCTARVAASLEHVLACEGDTP